MRTTGVSLHQKGKTSLDLNEEIGFLDGSGISWTICKQSASRSRQITTPTPHHSIFTSWMLLLMPNQQCQSNEGTHRMAYALIRTYKHVYNYIKACKNTNII